MSRNKSRLIAACSAFALVFWLATAWVLAAEIILVEKEIDDDQIIILRKNGDRLLLEKWTLRFSPLLFEGKTFVADVSSLWVTIHFEDRDPIKWSVKENLGRGLPLKTEPGNPSVSPNETMVLAQVALTLLGFDVGSVDESVGAKTRDAIRSFQKTEQLPQDGEPNKATLLALAARLSRRDPDDGQALEIALSLLSAANRPLSTDKTQTNSIITESHIQGDFEGWDGDTVFVLDNGEIWQQSSYAYRYHYAYRPKVIIYKTAGGHKMIVEGVSGTIHVRRIK